MNKKWVVLSTVAAVVVVFIAAGVIFKDGFRQDVTQALQTNSDALVRAHAPIFGNPAAKVTIVEFFDPSCETCRAFYPVVKGIVNASFGQVRLVVRYAPLHKGSDKAVTGGPLCAPAQRLGQGSRKQRGSRVSIGKRLKRPWPSSLNGPATTIRSPN
jgi:protein-disulfide isomerase